MSRTSLHKLLICSLQKPCRKTGSGRQRFHVFKDKMKILTWTAWAERLLWAREAFAQCLQLLVQNSGGGSCAWRPKLLPCPPASPKNEDTQRAWVTSHSLIFVASVLTAFINHWETINIIIGKAQHDTMELQQQGISHTSCLPRARQLLHTPHTACPYLPRESVASSFFTLNLFAGSWEWVLPQQQHAGQQTSHNANAWKCYFYSIQITLINLKKHQWVRYLTSQCSYTSMSEWRDAKFNSSL